MTEEDFAWTEFQECIDKLRSLGCAVIALTPMDIQSGVGTDENDEYIISIDQAADWTRSNSDSVEEAILSDYWGDTVSDVYQHSLERTA